MAKKLYVYLKNFYGWGVGYYSMEKKIEFDKKVLELQEALHCGMYKPFKDNGACNELKDYWGSLYCHPMELCGFVGEYQIDKIVAACRNIFGEDFDKFSVFDRVNLNDNEDLCGHILEYASEHTFNETKAYIDKLQHTI